MLRANLFSSRLMTAAFIVAMIGSFGLCLSAQEGRDVSLRSWQVPGVPDDWTHHHLVFSDPGMERDAIRKGAHDQWLRTVNDPRYVIHNMKRSDHWLPAQKPKDRDRHEHRGGGDDPVTQVGSLQRDWSVSMGTGTHGTAAVYPAKYGASDTTASCSDFMVFPTAAGSSTVPSLIAYNNLYKAASGGCTTTTPSQFWAANLTIVSGTTRYSTVTTSPVLSIDGSEVAFVANINGASYFAVLLMPTGNQGSVSSIACNTNTNLNNQARGSGTLYAWCSPLGTTDTYSSPYYDYTTNTVYVGDDSGNLHKFVDVFHSYGITGASTDSTKTTEASSPWPVAASSGNLLTSPVFDSKSNLIFVADNNGQVESVNASNGAFVQTTKRFSHGVGIVDAPVVDSSTGMVYVFAPEDEATTGCTSSPYCSTVYQLPYNFTAAATGTPAKVGTGSGSRSIYDGTFDNTYYNGTGTTGYMYVCGNTGGNPTLYQIPMSGSFGSGVVTVVAATSAAATCSPVTEVYNKSGTATDWIFFSVTGSGRLTGGTNNCTTGSACLYSYNVTNSGSLTFGNGLIATGGTSGIVIDTTQTVSSPGGTSQIYYETLGATSAVQVSQAALQ